MNIPEIVTKETRYYELVGFNPGQWGKEISIHETIQAAKDVAAHLVSTGQFASVTVREETVYIRNEHTEISTSNPIMEMTSDSPEVVALNAVSDFVAALIWDEAHYNEPCPITRIDAAYTLRQMAAEGRDLPAGINADLFCYFWNLHCDRYIEF